MPLHARAPRRGVRRHRHARSTSFGLFVTLDGLYVEGLVHITELGGEYFRFDEVRQELRGERTGMRYAVGTRVRVQVSRVDLDGRRIDFRLVREGEAERLLARAQRDKGAGEGRGGARRPASEELSAVQAADRAVKKARQRSATPRKRSAAATGAAGGKSGKGTKRR